MKSLSSEELSKYPIEYRVWVIINADDPDSYLVFPLTIENEVGVVAFLEQKDAEHMLRFIKERAEKFKNIPLEIQHDLLRELGTRSLKAQIRSL